MPNGELWLGERRPRSRPGDRGARADPARLREGAPSGRWDAVMAGVAGLQAVYAKLASGWPLR